MCSWGNIRLELPFKRINGKREGNVIGRTGALQKGLTFREQRAKSAVVKRGGS